MHQRVEAPDALDDFPTPPWATRAVLELLARLFREHLDADLSRCVAREPCANRGHMVKPLEEFFRYVLATDVHDYGSGYPLLDYLFPGEMAPANAVFLNPPYNLAVEFILRSFATPGWMATAAFVRTGFLEGGTTDESRYPELFERTPPTLIAQFCERVILHKGVLRNPDELYWDDVAQKMRKPSTATSYCWLLWIRDVPPQPFHWIVPCRKRLERPGDYPITQPSDGGPKCSEPSLLA